MNKTKISSILCLLLGLGTFNVTVVQAADTLPPLVIASKNAKAELANIKLSHTLTPVYSEIKNKKTGKKVKTLTGYTLTAKDIALAILDPTTNRVVITKGVQKDTAMTFPDPAVKVTLLRFNGVNSRFSVTKPAGGQVVALKYLITKTESGAKEKIEAEMYEALYTPYSSTLAEGDVVAYGANYLDKVIDQVAQDLAHLPSHAVPGGKLTAAIKPALIKSLVYAEHTETAQVLNQTNPSDSLNQLKVLLAFNEGDTYKYSVSSAGARGIAQFLPSTYQSLVRRHTTAGLMSDSIAGLSDHRNAIKAMYLLLDDYAGTIRTKAAASLAPARMFEYGAAAYNGGTTRVINAIKTFGMNWDADNSRHVQASETQVNSLTAQANSLKAGIKKTADKKKKAALQSELALVQSNLNAATQELNTVSAAALRKETVNYLQKIYKVSQYFNNLEVANRVE